MGSTRLLAAVALALALGLATAVSPFASSSPDGLNRVARDGGFAAAENRGALQEGASPVPGYAFPGVDHDRVATGLAGFTGTLAVFALGLGLARVLRRRPPPGEPA